MRISTETIQNLEFDKVLEQLSKKCISELGRIRLLNSNPFDNHAQLTHVLREVGEAKEVYQVEGGIPLWTFDDVRIYLNKIEPLESYLEAQDCQKIQNILEIAADLVKFFRNYNEKYPLLFKIISRLDPLGNLRKLIQSTIEPSGIIYDNASPDLKKIRNEIAQISKQIHIKLDRILRKQKEFLQEEYITLREGRLVLPVREYSVNKVPGIVHGQSATGQTYYVEPLSVVTLNNEMRELYAQEKKEIIKILKRLAANIRENSAELRNNLDILIHLDVLQAKAQYSLSCHGSMPNINEDFFWEIISGYHPLLLNKIANEAVPLSVHMGYDHRTMIITGPNAGGKTVALKTIGLLQLLFQSGFHIPVAESSKFPLCQNIFAVIGDEQSIENDLSTFSSHITKLNDIVLNASYRSLILIDEIGTGTDPSEGSALAIAVLEKLNKAGIVTIVTTHHGELKAFAHNMDNAVNAAMQFDRNTLSPRFILETGIPGSSYAFDISKRLGVDANILSRAQEILGSSHHDLEDLIMELTDHKQQLEKKIKELSIRETELEGLQSLYRTRADELKKNRKKYEDEAMQGAKDRLANVNKTIETVIREIRESHADSTIVKKGRSTIEQLKKSMIKEKAPSSSTGFTSTNLKIGQTVKSKRLSITGQITKIFTPKKEVEVEAKGVKLIISFNDLDILDHAQVVTEAISNGPVESMHVSNEIDLRGKLAEDAIIELQKYLDQAVYSNWNEVRIIHGKGTGALRKKIHEYLRKKKNVKSFRLGKVGEGDTGVTVIEI
jgi:DNA mismatch repair protein MutS2